MPTVSKILYTLHPEKKKKTSLQSMDNNFCGDPGPTLILDVLHFLFSLLVWAVLKHKTKTSCLTSPSFC